MEKAHGSETFIAPTMTFHGLRAMNQASIESLSQAKGLVVQ